MNKDKISLERKTYLNKIKRKKFLILLTQLLILVVFLSLWEYLARKNIIDSFITSQPSRILNTLVHLTSNDLLKHIGVTTYETIIGFLLGTILGIFVAIILWWSDFLSKVAEPFLVVLNSLPKVALRTNNNYLGRCWHSRYNSYGSCYFSNCYYFGKSKWFFKN